MSEVRNQNHQLLLKINVLGFATDVLSDLCKINILFHLPISKKGGGDKSLILGRLQSTYLSENVA